MCAILLLYPRYPYYVSKDTYSVLTIDHSTSIKNCETPNITKIHFNLRGYVVWDFVDGRGHGHGRLWAHKNWCILHILNDRVPVIKWLEPLTFTHLIG